MARHHKRQNIEPSDDRAIGLLADRVICNRPTVPFGDEVVVSVGRRGGETTPRVPLPNPDPLTSASSDEEEWGGGIL
jgi:hypothetical protein